MEIDDKLGEVEKLNNKVMEKLDIRREYKLLKEIDYKISGLARKVVSSIIHELGLENKVSNYAITRAEVMVEGKILDLIERNLK